MGTKGREIVQAKTNVQDVVDALQRAYADEWLSGYYYSLAAELASGIHADVVAGRLRSQASAELGHAQRIARRIIQLGAEPIRQFADLPKRANYTSFALPENPADIKGIIQAVLGAERAAIDSYVRLVEQTRHVDPVTHELAEELLADEVGDEDEWETLLAEFPG